jgi:hypothetical protein
LAVGSNRYGVMAQNSTSFHSFFATALIVNLWSKPWAYRLWQPLLSSNWYISLSFLTWSEMFLPPSCFVPNQGWLSPKPKHCNNSTRHYSKKLYDKSFCII